MELIVTDKRTISHRDLVRIWICYFLMPINIYSEYLEKITGINTLFFNIGCFMVLLFLSIPIFLKKQKIKQRIGLTTELILGIVILHLIIYGNYVNELKQASFIIEFMIVSTFYDNKYFNSIKKVIIVISMIMSVDTLLNLPKVIAQNHNLFNVRQYTMLDKPYYTLIFPLAIIFLISLMIKNKSKHIVLLSVMISLLCVVLFGIIGSKTALAATVLAIIIMLSRDKKKRKYLYLGLLGIGIASFIYFGILHKKVPDFLISIIYFFRGEYDIVSNAYAKSYFIRFEIVTLAFKTFLAHPFWGCGFNNYYNFVSSHGWQHYSLGVTDVESDLLAMFAEGGILYAILILELFWYIFIKLLAKKALLKTNTQHVSDALGCLICLFISIIGNDFMSSFFWCLLGIIYGCATCYLTKHEVG